MSLFFSILPSLHSTFFFFNDTATTEIYTLSLHDALPISFGWSLRACKVCSSQAVWSPPMALVWPVSSSTRLRRSEEHTSELQSHLNLVCRLLLEKKKKLKNTLPHITSSLSSTPDAEHCLC